MDKEAAIHMYIYICICIYTHNEILLSIDKNEILPFVTIWMHLEGIMLHEIHLTQKDKYFTYLWNVKKEST